MNRIEEMIARAEAELRLAKAAGSQPERDRHVIKSERLLDEAWRLNEADETLPPLESGLWCSEKFPTRRAA